MNLVEPMWAEVLSAAIGYSAHFVRYGGARRVKQRIENDCAEWLKKSD